MAFFSNDAINRVNLHSGVQALAQGAGGAFVFVFLLKAGVPTPLVLCTISAMTAGRFLLRPGVLMVAYRIGLRRTLMLGTVLEGMIFPILPHVHGPGVLLGAFIAVSSVGSVLYWTSYHAYFAALGDAESRGGQIGAREALTAVVNIVAPGLGAWALVTAGPTAAFWFAGVVQVTAALPLVRAPEVPIPREAPGGFRAAALGATLMATDGWFAACFFYVWQIALFVTLGEAFAGYGGAMVLAGLVGAVGSLALGRVIDLGHARRSVFLAYGACAVVVVARAAGVFHPWLAVAANALGAVAASLQAPAMMTRVYNLAKRSPCPLRFHMATEGGWDLGCSSGCLVAAGLVWGGLPLWTPILLGLPGAATGGALLLRSYGAVAESARARPLTRSAS